MKPILCPSMMCANYENLKEEIIALQDAGSDIFHIDIMDGQYVDNFAMGTQDIACIRKNSTIPVDLHLMIENPDKYIEFFAKYGVDIIYIHNETCRHPAKVLQQIRDLGIKAGLAVSPHVSFEEIKPLLSLCDYVMVMTVNPGFAGQKYLDFVDEKLELLVEYKNKYSYILTIDGACSVDKINSLWAKGVDGFVLGTSALFGKDKSYNEIIKNIKDGVLER